MEKTVFYPAQCMIFDTVKQDEESLRSLYAKMSEKKLIVDVSSVQKCDSAGLALLLEAKRLARKFHKSCSIVGMTKEILSLATFCGVLAFLKDEEK